jgi:hypothetical protein
MHLIPLTGILGKINVIATLPPNKPSRRLYKIETLHSAGTREQQRTMLRQGSAGPAVPAQARDALTVNGQPSSLDVLGQKSYVLQTSYLSGYIPSSHLEPFEAFMMRCTTTSTTTSTSRRSRTLSPTFNTLSGCARRWRRRSCGPPT